MTPPKNQKGDKADTISDQDVDDTDVLPLGMQKTSEVSVEDLTKDDEDEDEGTFASIETGRAGDMEGSGNRQDDEAAELEKIAPDLDDRVRAQK